MKHWHNVHHCACGRELTGNGGWTSHRARCPDWLAANPTGPSRISQNNRGYAVYLGVRGRLPTVHMVMAEKALGRPLPSGAQVHHVNGNRTDNRPENLVICPSSAYHALLHIRADSMRAVGRPDYRKCSYCGKHDHPAAMRVLNKNGSGTYARAACRRVWFTEYQRRYRSERRANAHE